MTTGGYLPPARMGFTTHPGTAGILPLTERNQHGNHH